MKRLNVALLLAVLATFGETSGAVAQNDREPPSLLISRPTRGEYLSSSEVLVEGSVSDAGSGVATLLVNGAPVTPDPVTGGFSARVPLDFGVNLITVDAADGAGNVAHYSASAMASPAYLPAGELVPNAAATRLTEPALQTIADRTALGIGPWINGNLAGQTLFRDRERVFGRCVVSALVLAEAVTFDPPRLVVDAVPTGLQTRLHLTNLDIAAGARSYCGVGYSTSGHISAQAVVVDVGLALSVDPRRALAVSITNSAVSLHGFVFNFAGIPGEIEDRVRSAVRGEVQSRIAEAVRARVPGMIHQTLSQLWQPVTRERNGTTVTFAALPASLTFDDNGFTALFDGSVTVVPDPVTPTAPGSIFYPSPGLPSYPSTTGFHLSISENLINRVLFEGWRAGFWSLTIDQAFLERGGLELPVPLDARLVAVFFPALRARIPLGQPVPLALRLEPRMPPVVLVSAGPGLLRLGLGELDLTLLVDLGAGFVPLLAMATHVEAAIDPVFDAGGLAFTMPFPGRMVADLLDAPVDVTDEDVGRFVQFIVRFVIPLAVASVRPVPVPALPGFTLSNLRLYPDGPAQEFVTLEGDIR